MSIVDDVPTFVVEGNPGNYTVTRLTPEIQGALPVYEETGKKFDDNKPPIALVSSTFIVELSKVLAFGALKYDPWNWKGGFKWSRIASAILRHTFAWLGGEDKDPESGLSHLAHAAAGIMFLVDFEANQIGAVDRYKK